MPPTERWPFRLVKPAFTDSATNLASISSLGERKVTFMKEREPFSAETVKSLEASSTS